MASYTAPISASTVSANDRRSSLFVMSAVAIVSRLMTDPSASVRYRVDGYVDVGVSYIGRIRFDDAGEFSLNSAGEVVLTGP